MSKLIGNLMRSIRPGGCFPREDEVPAAPRRLFGVDVDRLSDNLGRARRILDDEDVDQVDLGAFGNLLRHRPPAPGGAGPVTAHAQPTVGVPATGYAAPPSGLVDADEFDLFRRYGPFRHPYQDRT
jgi:hypothetical protein